MKTLAERAADAVDAFWEMDYPREDVEEIIRQHISEAQEATREAARLIVERQLAELPGLPARVKAIEDWIEREKEYKAGDDW